MTILATTTVEAAAVKARDQGDLIDSSAAFIATDGSSQSERRGRSALNKAASKTSSMGSSSEAKSTSAAPSPGVSEFAVSRKDRRKKDKGKAPILEGHGSKGKNATPMPMATQAVAMAMIATRVLSAEVKDSTSLAGAQKKEGDIRLCCKF